LGGTQYFISLIQKILKKCIFCKQKKAKDKMGEKIEK
jgi:hypothetical protein